jgi:hypothetical protein
MRGLLPICASCKNIRNPDGSWTRIDVYVAEHSAATFSHGLCPGCFARLYPDFEPPEG